ncbi:MAG: hypothetical protein KC994_10360 [Candidatus Omnitrophica bacterium]|nr:hypothetical protein [Candidatus Omnitrophota bacterium]
MPRRIEFVSYGLVVHLLLLPTPPRGDAVTVGYRPESVCLVWTFTTLIEYACRRTWNVAPASFLSKIGFQTDGAGQRTAWFEIPFSNPLPHESLRAITPRRVG